MMRRAARALRRLTRGLAALVVLVTSLLGLPAALVRFVGWPLPRTVPSWSALTDVLRGASITDSALIAGLACVVWLLWVLLVICFVSEVRAWRHGFQPRQLPIAGMMQPFVRELVVSVALLMGALRPGGTAPTLISSSAVMVTPVAPVAPTAPVSDTSDAPMLPTCVVAPRDSLWRLAETHLGDGLRWREIWDLNRDRTFPDHRRFVDPNLINPGWELSLPADAAVETAQEPPAPTPAPAQPAPSSPEPAPQPTVAPTIAPTTVPDRPAATNRPAAVPTAEADDPDYAAVPLLAGSALVAAGIVATLGRMRRRQLRRRTPGHLPRLPDPDEARSEVHLRRAAVSAPFDRLDSALRVLAHCLTQRNGDPCPLISAVSVGPDAVEVLLRDAVDAPHGPFDVEADGRAWTLPASVPDHDLLPIANTQAGPAPLLVTIGTLEDRSLLVDLEAGARTLVGGEPADATALLWTLALDLVTSNRADDVNVIIVGEPPDGIDAVGRARVFARVADAVDEINAEARAFEDALRATGASSSFQARVDNATVVLTPTVVLVAAPDDALDALLDVATRAGGLAVVVAGGASGDFDRELCVEDDTLVLKPVGLRLKPAILPAEITGAAAALIATAADLGPGEPLDLRPTSTESGSLTVGPDEVPLTFDAQGEPIVPAGHVMVRVLGPVEIVGGLQPIDRRRSIELVAYLALHPEGVDDGRLRTVLWPEGAPTQAAFNETVSRARRMLGVDPQGNHHLRNVENRRYRVGPYVFSDAALLEENVRSDNWLDVLRLVRGLPFDGTTTGYEWAYEEGQAHRLVVLIEEAGEGGSEVDVLTSSSVAVH